MVWAEQDYRFTVKMSLQILEEQRQAMREDGINMQNGLLRIGLHKSGGDERAEQDLYFQQYCVEWLDEHWEKMLEILEQHNEYSRKQRKDMILFFAEYFKELYAVCCRIKCFDSRLIPDLLEAEHKALDNLLECADRWEEKSRALEAEKAKHKERYQKLIENTKKMQ